METRKQKGPGFIFWLILIAIVFVIVYAIKTGSGNKENYTYEAFIDDIANGKVTGVDIYPNQEVPSGRIVVDLGDNSRHKAYVSDVGEVEQIIIKYNETAKSKVQYVLNDVERDSVLLRCFR